MTAIPNAVLLDLYACVDQAQRWSPMLDRICRDLGARSAAAQVFREDGHYLRQCWTARDSFSLAHAALHDAIVNNDENPRLDRRISAPIGSRLIVRDCDVFPRDCPQLADLEHRLASIGLGQSISINLPMTTRTSFLLILHRAENDRRPFTLGEEQYLRDLAPHFDQMLRHSRAREEVTADLEMLREGLQSLHVGIALCDADRRLHWLNSAAEAIVRRSSSLAIDGGMLKAVRSADDRKVEALVEAAARDAVGARQMLALGETQVDAVQLLAVPLRRRRDDASGGTEDDTRIAIFFSQGRQPRAFSADEIATLFGLSPSEALLAAALCQGSTINDHARHRGISVGTARIQLKQVMSKMNAHRQTDLVLQICGSVMGHAGAGLH